MPRLGESGRLRLRIRLLINILANTQTSQLQSKWCRRIRLSLSTKCVKYGGSGSGSFSASLPARISDTIYQQLEPRDSVCTPLGRAAARISVVCGCVELVSLNRWRLTLSVYRRLDRQNRTERRAEYCRVCGEREADVRDVQVLHSAGINSRW